MEKIKTIAEIRRFVRDTREKGAVIGFVPTMGYLHEGHLALLRRARRECGLVVASIFVNPLQFGPREDLAAYPRDLERDTALAGAAGTDVLFIPEVEEMYPSGFATHVEVAGLSEGLCGARRPGHFRGVTTVVAKFLQIVRPDRAYFGQKDAQQLVIIRRMVQDLNLEVEVVSVPTVREADGLAMSSRNVYLSPEERLQALALNRALVTARNLIQAGKRDPSAVKEAMTAVLAAVTAVRAEYAEVVDADSLQPLEELHDRVLLAVAARVGRARLIDNLVLRITPDTAEETAL